MRLDKFIADNSDYSRAQVKRLMHKELVSVNGEVVKDPGFKVTEQDQVLLDGEPMRSLGSRYLMLHKPKGYVCSTDDPEHASVLLLLDDRERFGLHMAGRLDLDTTGLVLLTDDGQWSHRVTSPKHQCQKRYRVWLDEPLVADAEARFLEGVQLRGERHLTKPAQLERISDTEVLLTISEGKYHQVKRMFAALDNKVVDLHREAVGALELDPDLAEGEYRPLTPEEVASLV
ncbi:16S rRNA pseudouridine(516) synthase RsuA [Gallaecimonas kandeliae]|uniref:16S rRNA pseudouridine(516) synthase RsuA n=1 Tax=Gallaecimonas kandeliae TaxID=3029055 RepID=UPI0026486E0D|nr:16S rRNA pseudouridine(516) synthase RsuA [Gallaecimonas kandeliae]WKE63962.1 16S rRNA pseudouridine(516) synthase RsuA [Gallaecimonas kandeliae]